MNESDVFSIECGTCRAAGTTACSDCVVTHLLANDDGPIDFVPVELTSTPEAHDNVAHVIGLFERAGLVDEPVRFVSLDDFANAEPRPAGAGVR